MVTIIWQLLFESFLVRTRPNFSSNRQRILIRLSASLWNWQQLQRWRICRHPIKIGFLKSTSRWKTRVSGDWCRLKTREASDNLAVITENRPSLNAIIAMRCYTCLCAVESRVSFRKQCIQRILRLHERSVFLSGFFWNDVQVNLCAAFFRTWKVSRRPLAAAVAPAAAAAASCWQTHANLFLDQMFWWQKGFLWRSTMSTLPTTSKMSSTHHSFSVVRDLSQILYTQWWSSSKTLEYLERLRIRFSLTHKFLTSVKAWIFMYSVLGCRLKWHRTSIRANRVKRM